MYHSGTTKVQQMEKSFDVSVRYKNTIKRRFVGLKAVNGFSN